MDNKIVYDIEYIAYSLNISDGFNEFGIETKDGADVNQMKGDLKNKKCDFSYCFRETSVLIGMEIY